MNENNENQREFVLSAATPEDIDRYLEIEGRVGSKTYFATTTKEDAMELIEEGTLRMIRINDEIAGFIACKRNEDDTAYISDFAVDPAYQGRGLGRKALEQVLAELSDVPKVTLVTHPENASAVALYESLGFKITERKENYFGDGEPRVVLVRE